MTFSRRNRRSLRTISATFYLDANQGSDANSGTSRSHAVATLSRAWQLVSEHAAASSEPIIVAMRSGVYRQTGPMTFGILPNSPEVIWRAFPGEKPILSGSAVREGWTETTYNGLRAWQVTMTAGLSFKSLFVNGEMRFRPRLPTACNQPLLAHELIDRDTYLYAFDPVTTKDDAPSFYYKAGDINPNWTNLSDVVIVASQEWISERMQIASIDSTTRKITMKYRPDGYPSWNGSSRYYVENVKEALLMPGQWYYDKPTGVCTYLPYASESLSSTTITVPQTRQLLSFDGAAHHRFEGIAFAETDWDFLTHSAQGGDGSIGAITLRNSTDIQLINCKLHSLGDAAVDIRQNVTHSLVSQCEISQIGSCGVIVTSELTDYTTAYNTITDNHIHHGGLLFHQACGVLAQNVRDTTISSNVIHHMYYTGVSVGWNWTFDVTNARNNTVEDNHIYSVGRNLLSDMGGIYMLGRQPGTVLRRNHIHDIQAYRMPGTGIYFDQGSALMKCEYNIVHHNMQGIWAPNYSSGQEITYNIVSDNTEFQIGAGGGMGGTIPPDLPTYRMRCTNNVITSERQYLFKSDTKDTISDNNLVWDFGGSMETFPNGSLRLFIMRRADKVVVASVTVQNPYTPISSFIFEALTEPLILPAGGSYYLLAEVSWGGGKWQNVAVLPTTSDASILGDVYKAGATYVENTSQPQGYGPFNFQYHVGSGTVQNFVTAPAGSTLRNDYTGQLGYIFTVGASPMTITALGTWSLASSGWWQSWTASGQDQHSVIADPRYIDRANGNYILSSQSPAHSPPINYP